MDHPCSVTTKRMPFLNTDQLALIGKCCRCQWSPGGLVISLIGLERKKEPFRTKDTFLRERSEKITVP